MRFYLMTDLEGVAGVYQWEDRDDTSCGNHECRMRQRRWLAREVGAAVDGFFAGGMTEVLVNDGHGAGYTIDLDELDGRALVINGSDRPFWLPYLDESCAATGLVGAHAKAGTEGACLYHTMSKGVRNWTFNGISLGEAGVQAAIAGHYGVPFVFIAGDVYACREMEQLIPGIVTAPVKVGLSRTSALHRTPAEARQIVREGAQRATKVIRDIKPFKLASPILFRDERVEPEFDEEKPPEHSRVLNARTREIEGQDILDLMQKIYPSYRRGWKPLPTSAVWGK
ncbi:MAG: M55 family metallopeptidase [Planctomycetota bacterium]|nr:M55 family metallopeptidase [Planctomycetota bacterium]